MNTLQFAYRPGAMGIARAFRRFAQDGLQVFFPPSDRTSYDLAVDFGENLGLQRVQVKYTSTVARTESSGYYRVKIKRSIKRRKVTVKKSHDLFDYLFVADAAGNDWLIPRVDAYGDMTLNPSGKNAKFLF